jgi:RND family efflux transporter MFP subunit
LTQPDSNANVSAAQVPEPRDEVTLRGFSGRQPGLGASQAWLGRLCGMLDGVDSGLLVLEESPNIFAPVGVWPHGTRDVTHLGNATQKCLAGRAGGTQPGKTDQTIVIICPIEVEGRLYGAVALEVSKRPVVGLQKINQQLSWGMGWLESHFWRQKSVDAVHQLERAAIALDIAALAGEHVKLEDASLAIASELCKRFTCTRIAIGIERKNQVRLVALSNSASFEKKSQFVAEIENAMDEALDQHKTVAYPPIEGVPKGIAVAHKDVAKTGSVLSVVLRAGGRGTGVITFERAETRFTLADVELCQATASLIGPILQMKEEATHWIAGRSAQQLRALSQAMADPRRPSFRYAAGSLLAFLIFISVFTVEYRVPAKAVLEGEVQRAVVAPFEGYIAHAYMRAGQTVKQGQLLAKLDDRDLLVERQKWSSEFEQNDRKYRDALAKRDRPQARILAAQVAQTEAQLVLVEDKLERTAIVAPFDGIVVTGDLTQMFGSPVERGKLLFEVAPLDAYRVILKVDERDIRDVAVGQKGTIILSGISNESMPLDVTNISIAEAEEGHNYFHVEAKLRHAPPRLRPGMEGVGKIIVGERTLIWIWTHRFMDWLRMLVWYWLP